MAIIRPPRSYAPDLARGDEVISAGLTFVATANAAVHAGGMPHFADVELKLVARPTRLRSHLKQISEYNNGELQNYRCADSRTLPFMRLATPVIWKAH